MEAKTAAIAIHDLFFSYEANVEVLSDVQLDIYPLDSICIVGPNGGGKSTLVKLMLGLLSPDRGTIRIFGEKPKDARLRFGYVPQYARFDPQFLILVREVVAMGMLGHSLTGHHSKKDRERVMAALEKVGMADLANHSFSSLSGGQRQRVLIARSLASEGDILILDEPTASIDRQSEDHLFDLLGLLNRSMTILMVTHEVGFASSFFKRIACVNRNVVIHPTSELTGELIRDMYGGDLRMIRHDHRCCAEGHQHE
ncbi:MAG: ABC transporter ATP-binding protein [Thermodesulfobacteriota bacterium]